MDTFDATIAELLATELRQVAASLAQAAEDAGPVELDQTSVGRLSRMDAMQQQAMAQGRQQRLRQRLRQLQAAQDRLEQATYGRCCQCDENIDPARLHQDPAVVFCIACEVERNSRDRLR